MLKRKSMLVWMVTAVFVLGFAGSSLGAWGTSELETEKIAVAFAKEVARGGYGIVTTSELKSWIDAKKPMLIVDTMPYEASYKKEHVPGAVPFELSIPELTAMDDKTKADFLKMLGPDKGRLIVFYCGFTKCTRSHNGAMWAVKLGYKNVFRYPGGIKGWAEADYPVESVR